jgi:hypothetical protein
VGTQSRRPLLALALETHHAPKHERQGHAENGDQVNLLEFEDVVQVAPPGRYTVARKARAAATLTIKCLPAAKFVSL